MNHIDTAVQVREQRVHAVYPEGSLSLTEILSNFKSLTLKNLRSKIEVVAEIRASRALLMDFWRTQKWILHDVMYKSTKSQLGISTFRVGSTSFVKQCMPADKEFWHQKDPWFVDPSSIDHGANYSLEEWPMKPNFIQSNQVFSGYFPAELIVYLDL